MTTRRSMLLGGVFSACAALTAAAPLVLPAGLAKRVIVRFSPDGGCADLVAWHIDSAEKTVHVASYQWSNRKIHDAAVRARRNGRKVQILLDDSPEERQMVKELVAAGFGYDELRVDDKHKIFHDKYTLRDAGTPKAAHENGSYNYSESAEHDNAENAQVVEGFPDQTAEYLADWKKHWDHGRPVKVK